ncbi:hypothetical protein CKW39_06100 [Kocuria sp. WRN011]|uniref:SRPBCC family protein n=1 Tax=Kocuria carniphila TaxID=262208 RepID=A0ABV3V1R4_9MICC|nr:MULTISPECIES: hypothetical protein [Kocuria]MCT1802305.1 hypothetical protein [Kocuria carniphila]PBB09118.1 hypothetical protein CKW39_06100 [Kocuria sp. WRN011]PZP35413.1 MAG: hypothetical protein DI613_04640 [Kocuria rhizophila]
MHETDTPHGFLISTQEFVPATADEFERVLRAPGSIAAWNELELSGPAGSGVPLDVGDAMEFTVNVGPLSFDYVMIVAARTSGVSFIQRTTKGFVDVTIEYSWKTQGVGTLVTVDAMYRLTGPLWWKKPATRAVARKFVRTASRNMRDMFSPRRSGGRGNSTFPDTHGCR